MLGFEFMRNALFAGTLVAVLAGVIGVFVLARQLVFLTHALSHIGFSGAALSVLLNWNLEAGLMGFTTLSAMGINWLGIKSFRKDVVTGVVTSVFLGLGILFLSLSQVQSSAVTSLLFGNVVGISAGDVQVLFWLTIGVLVVLFFGYRWLRFESFDAQGAEARGLPVRWISLIFLILFAISVAESFLIVGALLVLTLVVVPAASARQFEWNLPATLALSVGFAVVGVWIGLMLGYWTNLPVSFYISAVEGLVFGATYLWKGRSKLGKRRPNQSQQAVG